MNNSPRKRAGVLVWLLLASLLAGCSSKGSVSGKVLYKGQPVTGGNLIFQTDKGNFFRAIISEDGTYTMEKVPSGPVQIGVENEALKTQAGAGTMIAKVTPKDQKGNEQNVNEMMQGMMKQMNKGGVPGKYVPIPEKVKDPKTSGLTYTVTGGSQVHDIELKD